MATEFSIKVGEGRKKKKVVVAQRYAAGGSRGAYFKWVSDKAYTLPDATPVYGESEYEVLPLGYIRETIKKQEAAAESGIEYQGDFAGMQMLSRVYDLVTKRGYVLSSGNSFIKRDKPYLYVEFNGKDNIHVGGRGDGKESRWSRKVDFAWLEKYINEKQKMAEGGSVNKLEALNKKYARNKKFKDSTAVEDINSYFYHFSDTRNGEEEKKIARKGIIAVTGSAKLADEYIAKRKKLNEFPAGYFEEGGSLAGQGKLNKSKNENAMANSIEQKELEVVVYPKSSSSSPTPEKELKAADIAGAIALAKEESKDGKWAEVYMADNVYVGYAQDGYFRYMGKYAKANNLSSEKFAEGGAVGQSGLTFNSEGLSARTIEFLDEVEKLFFEGVKIDENLFRKALDNIGFVNGEKDASQIIDAWGYWKGMSRPVFRESYKHPIKLSSLITMTADAKDGKFITVKEGNSYKTGYCRLDKKVLEKLDLLTERQGQGTRELPTYLEVIGDALYIKYSQIIGGQFIAVIENDVPELQADKMEEGGSVKKTYRLVPYKEMAGSAGMIESVGQMQERIEGTYDEAIAQAQAMLDTYAWIQEVAVSTVGKNVLSGKSVAKVNRERFIRLEEGGSVKQTDGDELGFFSNDGTEYVNLQVGKSSPNRKGKVVRLWYGKTGNGQEVEFAEVKFRDLTENIKFNREEAHEAPYLTFSPKGLGKRALGFLKVVEALYFEGMDVAPALLHKALKEIDFVKGEKDAADILEAWSYWQSFNRPLFRESYKNPMKLSSLITMTPKSTGGKYITVRDSDRSVSDFKSGYCYLDETVLKKLDLLSRLTTYLEVINDNLYIKYNEIIGSRFIAVVENDIPELQLPAEKMEKGGSLSKEDAISEAIKEGVDFNKDFYAQSVGGLMAELAKKCGYRKPKTANGSTGRYFFAHLSKIVDKQKKYQPKLYATYNEYGYEIMDTNNNEKYSAGNSPYDSQASVPLEDALPLETIKKYAIQTGNEIAKEEGLVFIGAQYEAREEEVMEHGGNVENMTCVVMQKGLNFGKFGTALNSDKEKVSIKLDEGAVISVGWKGFAILGSEVTLAGDMFKAKNTVIGFDKAKNTVELFPQNHKRFSVGVKLLGDVVGYNPQLLKAIQDGKFENGGEVSPEVKGFFGF